MIYSLEHLEESKKLITNEDERKKYIQAKKRTLDIINQLKQRTLSRIQRISLVFLGINPCLVFSIGIKFQGLLERFL